MTVFDHDEDLSKPGQWRHSSEKAIISCPVCGHFGGLGNHTIAADGTVTPSLVCPWAPCTYHDMGRLEGWSERR